MNSPSAFHRGRPTSFTLVEMLTVILIIAILSGLLLGAVSGVLTTAKRDRAKAEITAMSSSLESYKSDNGAYPVVPATVSPNFAQTNDYTANFAGAANGAYQNSSSYIYQQLTGRTNYADPISTTGTKIYYPFKHAQLGNDAPASGQIYIKDPFNNSYGYFAGNPAAPANVPVNGAGQFDLWSTAGDSTNPNTKTATWITDWSN